MIFIIKFSQLDTKFMNNKKYSLYLNEARFSLIFVPFVQYAG